MSGDDELDVVIPSHQIVKDYQKNSTDAEAIRLPRFIHEIEARASEAILQQKTETILRAIGHGDFCLRSCPTLHLVNVTRHVKETSALK